MRCFVAGGAGFIGLHLCAKLLERGHEVVAYDKSDPHVSAGFRKSKALELEGTGSFSFVKGDVLDGGLAKALEGADTVFHLAAEADVTQSVKDPANYHRINVDGTFNVLLASRDAGVKKIVFASSSAVYGELRQLPVSESYPCLPVSPYGATKLIGEEYCMLFDRLYGLKANALRYFTVYGPGQRLEMAIAGWTHKIFETGTVDVKGLVQTRDFTYVEDAAEATALAAEKGVHGEAFNIGSGTRVSIKEVLDRIIELYGKKVVVENLGMRPGDPMDTYADISKAGRMLGYSPKVMIGEGLERYVEWYKKAYPKP